MSPTTHIVEKVGIYNWRMRIMASWWIVINNAQNLVCYIVLQILSHYYLTPRD